MPRKSSDSYVTHRIELGKYERDLISGTVIPTYAVASIGKSLPYIVVGGCAVVLTWGTIWALFKIYGFKDEAVEVLTKTIPKKATEPFSDLFVLDNYKLVNKEGQVQFGFGWLADLLGMEYEK